MNNTLRLFLSFLFLVIGCIEIIISVIGIIKFNNTYFKLHLLSKITTTGIIFISSGLLIYSNFNNLFKFILILQCLFFSSSYSTHIISRIRISK